MKKRTKKPLPVMPAQCGTCIFREDGNQVELCQGRMSEIRSYLIMGKTHICHHAQLKGTRGPDKACRGGRDFQLMIWSRFRMIAEPTDEALEAAMNALGVPPPPRSGKEDVTP